MLEECFEIYISCFRWLAWNNDNGNVFSLENVMSVGLISQSNVEHGKMVKIVRSGIRTHAYKSRLRPERSALDRSAILTCT